MEKYQLLQTSLYDKIILSLLRKHILSLHEAIGCLNDISTFNKVHKGLTKDFIMVKQKGLTNTSIDKSDLEGDNSE